MSKDLTKHITIYIDDRDEFITIDTEISCRQCGTVVEGSATNLSDGLPFKICPLHCAGCPETSTKPNPLGDWHDETGVMFQAPICSSCYQSRVRRSELTTGPMIELTNQSRVRRSELIFGPMIELTNTFTSLDDL